MTALSNLQRNSLSDLAGLTSVVANEIKTLAKPPLEIAAG